MDNLRLFISLPLEPGLSKRLLSDFKRLDLPWSKLKVVPAQDLHLTLKFLGDTPLLKLPEIISALEKVDINLDNFDLSINGVKIFNPQRPQVIVLSFEDNKELQLLYGQIEAELFKANLAHKEMKKFTPHVTLARVKQAANIDEFNNLQKWTPQRDFSVNHFNLQESLLTAQGPEYSILQSFNL